MTSRVTVTLCGLATGCVLVESEPPDVNVPIDCVAIAIRDPNGEPDGCDVAACTTCVDHCGGKCAVLESYPPQYSCPDRSFSVYDFCENWSTPYPSPRADDVVDLGCGYPATESLTAVPTGPGAIAVVHVDALTGCCPVEIEVAVEAADAVLTVGYTPVDDLCDCACLLDVSYDVVDVPAGDWTIVAGESGATTTVTVP